MVYTAIDNAVPSTTTSVADGSTALVSSGAVYAAIDTALEDYIEAGGNAGGVTASTISAKIRSQSPNTKLRTEASYTTRLEGTTRGWEFGEDWHKQIRRH